MRRLFFPLGLAVVTVASVVLAQGAGAAPESGAAASHRGGGGGGGGGYFAVACGFSHRNMDDPIVQGAGPLARPHVLRRPLDGRLLDAGFAPRGRADDLPASSRYGRVLGANSPRWGEVG